MNPLRLRAENFRSYDTIDLEFPEGAVAIAGANGAGKSSLIAAFDVALFGSRSLGDYLSEDANTPELLVELEFEHAGERYRVRRSYSAKGRGKSTTDLERWRDYPLHSGDDEGPTWDPITRESQAATQEAIEEILGLSRESFHASALLMQGDSGAFTEAKPAERKAILADVLGLQRWEQLLELVRVDKRQTERAHSELAGRISVLEERSGDTAELEGVCSRLRSSLVALEEELAGAAAQLDEAALAARTQETAEATYRERAAAVDAATARAQSKQAVVDRAAAAKLEAVELQSALAEAGDPSARLVLLETQLGGMDRQREARREAETIRDRYLADAQDARREQGRLIDERSDVVGLREVLAVKLGVLNESGAEHRCPTCDQELHGEAHALALTRLREEHDGAQRRVDAYTARIDKASGDAQSRLRAAEQVEIPDDIDPERYAAQRQAIDEARRAELTLVEGRTRLSTLEAAIAELTPEVMAEVEACNVALSEAQNALAEISKPEPGALPQAQAAALAARGRLSEVQARVTQAQAEKAAADARLEAARETFVELEQARLRAAEFTAELEHLVTLERAYGRDGIPSLIVEASAIPQIETEANRILAELGTPYRVELRTQRELKSGDGLADTLDVVVIGDVGARPYETFSGSEKARINIALRLALSRLLAHRRGAESKVLVLDEVEYLDVVNQQRLVDVVLSLRGEYDRILTISHADALRDAFDTTIEVVKDDSGRSTARAAA